MRRLSPLDSSSAHCMLVFCRVPLGHDAVIGEMADVEHYFLVQLLETRGDLSRGGERRVLVPCDALRDECRQVVERAGVKAPKWAPSQGSCRCPVPSCKPLLLSS